MSGWDTGLVSSVGLDLQQQGVRADRPDLTNVEVGNQLQQFIRTFKETNRGEFIYREQLKSNWHEQNYYLNVNCDHLRGYSQSLFDLISQYPAEYIPVFENAAKIVALQITGENVNQAEQKDNEISIQIQLTGYPDVTSIRALSADHVSKLVTIRGIVVSASRPRIKATSLMCMCRNCKNTRVIRCGEGFGGARMPRECDSRPAAQGNNAGNIDVQKCPLDPYMILSDNSQYIDQQRLKLQENSDSVPTGELPRHMSLSLERYLVGSVKPGTRITCIGIYTTYEAAGSSQQDKNANGATDGGIRIPYLRVLGVEQENEASDVMLGRYSHEEEEEMYEVAKQDHLYEKISRSMCPAIFDSDDILNIKQALAVQLFGGSRKQLPDGMRLRGDINVLLLGDPSVAKSQFLKFVSQVAPIGVYTTGKGASAAGLTASVIRDTASGEFHLEGGALVLADGGIVCIDEFDKMRENDRVAIHEAMEQQTISIAKAGITTILNSRTSVLAAANPVFGRYDDMRSPTENIDFQTSILSRFDLIFIVRDIQDPDRDARLALHVINVHRKKDEAVKEITQKDGVIEIATLRKYIAFSRAKVNPRLSEEAAKLLQDQYVKFRTSMPRHSGTSSNIPITVRQLEAIVRIAEARARMELKDVADVNHVMEAIRLFQVSTFRAATTGLAEGGVGNPAFDAQVQRAEKEILHRMPLGSTFPTAQLIKHLEEKQYERIVIARAISMLTQRSELKYLNQQKKIQRVQ